MLLRASGIYKSFRSLLDGVPSSILQDVSLSIDYGEIVTLVGESGSGKTTLLSILGLLEPCDQGDIEFEGNYIVRGGMCLLNDEQLLMYKNQSIGFVFQFHHLLDDFTAVENVAFPHYINSKNMSYSKDVAAALLTQLGLSSKLNHLPSQLSGGESQRVAIARAIINSPKIVFADEPSGNLDSKTSKFMAYKNVQALEFGTEMQADVSRVILDVRTQEEFLNDGSIESAINIDYYQPDFQQRLAELDKTKTYLVYCRSGKRSADTCKTMSEMGFPKLINLDGGYLAFSKTFTK
ncbi:hypothetical protein CHS0354_023843 [Potamilus streckersoni]|uniref:Lipoprotein-releasing system ATP-binding protein LolD n=1 Tax=Potamilus streckersoni TaxID=2493646 RepID=A0AAE0RZ91_9BIVA|nr:hypothetical protein CHS0354_023843 [Potamilus streckersoni]